MTKTIKWRDVKVGQVARFLDGYWRRTSAPPSQFNTVEVSFVRRTDGADSLAVGLLGAIRLDADAIIDSEPLARDRNGRELSIGDIIVSNGGRRLTIARIADGVAYSSSSETAVWLDDFWTKLDLPELVARIDLPAQSCDERGFHAFFGETGACACGLTRKEYTAQRRAKPHTRESLSAAILADQLASGGHDTPYARELIAARIDGAIAWVGKWRRDMDLVGKLGGHSFCATERDRMFLGDSLARGGK